MAEHIRLQFPADTEYIGAIRLAVSGIAGKMDFKVDEIEDLKSCVAEACILLLCGQKCAALDIGIDVDGEIRLKVEGTDVKPGECEDCAEFNEEISRIMIEALSDDAEFHEENGILYSIAFQKRHAS